ncbi:usherin [Bombina bombina]|uniref:usherin n=1 Tax=Bombina bombina TaxID=8345 RepID=UPI00235A698F|nr:usherin [Bombina bombina]
MFFLVWTYKLDHLFHVLECILVGYYIYLPIVKTQGYFPKLENVGGFKPVTIVPLNATCGLPERSVFCHRDTDLKSIHNCPQLLCIQECPYRSSSPSYHQLLNQSRNTCIKKDKDDLHPGSDGYSTSYIFFDHKDCFVTSPNLSVGSSFTLSVWLKPERQNVMCVIEKSADGQIVFKLTISDKETVFYYRTVNGLQPPIKVMTQGRFSVKKWIHLSVQVHYTRINFFINGLEKDQTAFVSRNLSDSISDITDNSIILLGQNINGMDQFIGRMQDFRMYQVALTNREIMEVFSKEFPYLHVQSECRCPSTHPHIHSLEQRYCIPNYADNMAKDKTLRLNADAHPASYINDNNLGTTWISSLSLTSDVRNVITITFDLVNGQYQVFYIILQFYSFLPYALKIQRKTHRYSEWEDWQYFATDCQFFGMENNGVLEYSDSINCLQLSRATPFFRKNVTFSLLTPEPNHRPGYNEFFNTPILQEFVKASFLRIQLFSHNDTEWSDLSAINLRQRYYGIDEITISGRCNCYGHAKSCDISRTPYQCHCEISTHTDGENCDRCLPLFNDKHFHQGDQVNAFNCRLCQCNNHSFSCHYNITLDPYPYDHEKGGGGVCDNCLHNTTGRHCELCKDYFYRQVDTNLSAIDVCKPCDCNEAGTVNRSLHCEKIGGQCHCKKHVSGRQCNHCKHGFFNLQRSNCFGCRPCKCNTSGTVNGEVKCHQTSGQCKCKPNVTGLQCDRCNLGFKQDISGNRSCIPCKCNSYGSINQFCNPINGQCKCREHVKGVDCDTCIDSYYGLDSAGCKHCDCNKEGIIPETVCDAVTGQCVCRPYIGGRQCNECLDGFYKILEDNSMMCIPCNCDVSGTINHSQSCDKTTGQCFCKAGVTGQQCNLCKPHMYNLTIGCHYCDCDPLGTLANTVCDQVNGQCECLPNYQGRRCNQCLPGFYSSSLHGMACISCSCHTKGAVNKICNFTNGQCTCKDLTVNGQKCDQCSAFFFGFDSSKGSCQPCNCNPAGSTNGTCHSLTGQCFCKEFVQGYKCADCTEDASSLEEQNPYGCSKTPFQQPPPIGHVVNSTAIRLMWHPPDSTNTNKMTYVLYRNEQEIFTTTDFHPFSFQDYTDTALVPYTVYSYHVDAKNVHGLTRSTNVFYQTKAGSPIGDINLYLDYPAGPFSASLHWIFTSNDSSPIERFILTHTSIKSSEPNVSYEGLKSSMTVHNLVPFTKYNFFVQACTVEGCLQSKPVTVITAQAPPVFQEPPVMINTSSSEIHLQWAAPLHANGIIIRYELYMRSITQSDDNPIQSEKRVFQASGWLNPQPVVESQNENALMPPPTNTVVTNLEPNTKYEFCVVSVNMAGSISSEWITMKTEESEPVFMPPPSVFPLSSTSLNVSWEKPNNRMARGEITGFTINVISQDIPDNSHTGETSEVLYVAENHELFHIVTALKVYHIYVFTITLCNNVGCVTSRPGMGQTLAAAPGNIHEPSVTGINSTTMRISWASPLQLNGPSPTYLLERTDPSFTITSKTDFIKGIHFPGNGYLKFSSSTLPENTYFTGIKIQFRTKELDGLILCAVSAGMQDEYIALQIRNGRPYFLFDPQGSAVAVSPTNDDGRLYNDNKWHQIVATRNQATGYIRVDGRYTGSSSALSGSTIIGENTGVYIGGFPKDFVLRRSDTGDAKITKKSFVGCLGDIFIKQRENLQEIWEALDWEQAELKLNVYDKWEGCPENLHEGVHFLSFGFLELFPSVFPEGSDFELSFMFKTDQLKGILLFVYDTNGPDYLLAQLDNGILSSKLKSNSVPIQLNLWAGLSYCNGKWNKVTLKKEGSIYLIQLNNLIERFEGLSILQSKIHLNSNVYIGGVPDDIQELFPDLDLQHGFGGCIKDTQFIEGLFINFASVSRSAVRVILEGCPATDSLVNCRGKDSVIVYQGKEETVYERGLQSFTEYLYRVTASNERGSGTSSWSRGRTRAVVPENLKIPLRVLNINAHSVEVTWDRPSGVTGVIEQYILKAYPENSPNIFTSNASFPDNNIASGTVSGLQPFTMYAVTVSVCTSAGCSESSHALNISTLQKAPEEMQAPLALSFPDSLYLHWLPPKKPNGIIIQYILYMNGNQIYIGNATEHNVTALETFTPHQFLLIACTTVGCTNSSQVTLFTAQLPPAYVSPPVLTVLNSTSLYVQWEKPKQINGILDCYMLHISNNLNNRSSWNTIYNSSELFVDYTIHKLIPGTKYFVKISACTKGGCATSDYSMAITEESLPQGIPVPNIYSYSTDSFNISWSEPQHPNGILTEYGLYMDGILMQNSSRSSYFVDGLSPWSKYSFRLQACTAKGCALGPKVEAYTQEAKPEGFVLVHAITEGPRGIQIKWQGPENPNGQLTYAVIFNGLFYEMKGDDIYAVINEQRVLHSSIDKNKWVFIGGLIPYSNYSIHVNASNNQGYVISDEIILTMPSGAPDGVLPPRLSSATPTSLQVVWSTPVRNNAPGLPCYRLQMRTTKSTNETIELLSGPSASVSHAIKDLQPFTKYQLRIVASNKYGDTNSKWVTMSTKEDKPGTIDPPLLFSAKSRSLNITWYHPKKPNGIITHYNIYQNGSLEGIIPGNSSEYEILNLNPHTVYGYHVEACTSAGCSVSLKSIYMTLPDAPSGVQAPDLYSDSPTSVTIRWTSPLYPNGLIENVTIERRLKGAEEVNELVTLPLSNPMHFTDQTTDVSPWKTYEYRIVMSTVNGGKNASAWAEVTTRPSRPGGVEPPEVIILSPCSAKVSWKIPIMQNGDKLNYEIRMPDPRISIVNTTMLSYTVTNLIPYTNYSVTIVACSVGGIYHGGCTESLPTYVTTDPTIPEGISPLSATPISETVIAISWQPPLRPNGPNLRYELLRRKILQPLASNPPEDLNLWQNIYSGTQRFYEDKVLSRYTSYEYRLIVHNMVGYSISADVVVTTMAGYPIRGSNATALAINHTAIEVEWTKPTLQDLQGDVELYTLVLKSSKSNKSLTFQADVNHFIIGDLYPNTKYQLYLQVFNGAHSINSDLVHVTTLDGAPEGMFPPEVVTINSTAVQVIWTPPSNPNGFVKRYSIYVNNKLYNTERKTPIPFILVDLLPFVVYNIQVEACTTYACIKSNGTQIATLEDKPTKMLPLNVSNIQSRYRRILHDLLDWAVMIGAITKSNFEFLLVEHSIVPIFHYLPKIHKSMTSPPGRPIVAGIGSLNEPLSAMIDTLLQPIVLSLRSYIRDTTEFIKQIEQVEWLDDHSIVPIDVVSLYTSIPHDKGDDSIIDDFFDYLSDNHQNLRFTMNTSRKEMPFLDVLIKPNIDTHSIGVELYRKESAGNTLLMAKSNHPRHVIKAIPKGQYMRTKRNCSTTEAYEAHSEKTTERFLERGYKIQDLKEAKKQVDSMARQEMIKGKWREKVDYQQRPVFITMYSKEYNDICQIIKKSLPILSVDETMDKIIEGGCKYVTRKLRTLANILSPSMLPTSTTDNWLTPKNVFFHCGSRKCTSCSYATLGDTFKSTGDEKSFKIKEYINCNTSYVIYLLTCKLCNIKYVGQTTRTLKTRILEHLRSIGDENSDTPVALHFKNEHNGNKSLLSFQAVQDDILTLETEVDNNAVAPNLTYKERMAIKSLRDDCDIVIKNADKGGSIVVMDKSYYFEEALSQLNNDKIYRRPIVSGIGSLFEPLGAWIDTILQPIARGQLSFLEDNSHLLRKLAQIQWKDQYTWIVVDISSLYTCIPQFMGVSIVESFLDKDMNFDDATRMYVGDVLRSAQIEWSPPGEPNGIILGYNLIRRTLNPCVNVQKSVMDQGDQSCSFLKCRIYEEACGGLCYNPQNQIVKDTTHVLSRLEDVTWESGYSWITIDAVSLYSSIPHECGLKAVSYFLRMETDLSLEHRDVGLSFTFEWNQTSVNYLDVTLSFDASTRGVSSSLYRKPISGNTLLHARSSHPRHVFKGIAKGQFMRIKINCSREKDFLKESEVLKSRLKDRGYPKNLFNRAFSEVSAMDRKSVHGRQRENKLMHHPSSKFKPTLVTAFSNQFDKVCKVIEKNLPILRGDMVLRKIMDDGCNFIYKCNLTLGNILSPSMLPQKDSGSSWLKVCCNEVLHNRKAGYECCEDKYIQYAFNSSVTCCGGQIHMVLEEHQCCGGYYTKVRPGEICCYNRQENRVSIGNGDLCCGDVPFSTSRNQICCGETLHNVFNQQCCGGKIIGQDVVCCGDKEKGETYKQTTAYPHNLFTMPHVSRRQGKTPTVTKKTVYDHFTESGKEPNLVPNEELSDPESLDAESHSRNPMLLCGTEEGNFRDCERAEALERKQDDLVVNQTNLLTYSETLANQMIQLEFKMADIEDRSRRNNIRFRGISETVETTDLHSFLRELFAELVGSPEGLTDTMERAHRALRSQSVPAEKPWHVIVCFHSYIYKDKLMQAAFKRPNLSEKFKDIQLLPDQSAHTLQYRKTFQPITLALRKANIKYRWGHPTNLVVTRNNQSHIISTIPQGMALLTTWAENLDQVKHSNISLCPWSDHDLATVTFCSIEQNSTRPSWRLPHHVFQDASFKEILRKDIIFYSQSNDNRQVRDDTLWGAAKATFRGLIIQRQAHLKKLLGLPLSMSHIELRRLELLNRSAPSDITIDKITKIKNHINQLELKHTQANLFKLKQISYHKSNEADTFLANKLKNRASLSRIHHIQSGNQIYRKPSEIGACFEKFYSKLYNLENIQGHSLAPTTNIHSFLDNLKLPKLSLDDQEALSSPFTLKEIKHVITHMKTFKTPGPGGYSASFYKTYINKLAPLLLKFFNQAREEGNFAREFLEATVITIPKPQKDPSLCSNYRPISLINLDVKIYAKLFAIRISKLLPQLINLDQVGFIPNHEGPDNTRRLLNICTESTRLNKPFSAISLDAEKAFDRVRWSYLWEVLRTFGFPDQIVKVIQAFYSAPSATVKGLGFLFLPFPISNGTRQGCPLSPLLFALAIVPLAEQIRQDRKVDGVRRVCCGSEYVNISEYTCCLGSNGNFKVHLKQHNNEQFKCCSTFLIPVKEECCNSVGYNPTTHICSDKITAEIYTKEEKCNFHVVCPISLSATAYCGECRFDSSTESCFWSRGTFNNYTNTTVKGESLCQTKEKIIYAGDPDKYTFTDINLDPFTTYEYRVSSWNSFDNVLSPISRILTKEDKPQGIRPPRWANVDNNEDMIILKWNKPSRPNGVVHYIVVRDGIEIFRGQEQSFKDKRGIRPFIEYVYQLRACTAAGCLESDKVIAATKLAVPQDVSPPNILPVNSTALHLIWSTPKTPNGKIKEYQIYQTDEGLVYTSTTGKKQYTLGGLEPYTNYSFSLIACTSAGCTASEASSSQTLQDSPQGVWSKPCHIKINASVLELYWNEPDKPNGIISQYRLIRNREVISTRSGEYLNFTDVGLQPNSRYIYQLEASTNAGSNLSKIYVIETSLATPEKISVPNNVTVLGPHSLFLSWDTPGTFDAKVNLKYNILLNACATDSQVYAAGEEHFIILEDLNPYTQYNIRLQACQNGSCGVSDNVCARTVEAIPEDLNLPHVMALGPKTVKVQWAPPLKPNGIIHQYFIHSAHSVGYLQRDLDAQKQELTRLEKTLKSSLSMDDLNKLLTSVKTSIAELKSTIENRKRQKFQRDEEDYRSGNVYRWTQDDNRKKPGSNRWRRQRCKRKPVVISKRLLGGLRRKWRRGGRKHRRKQDGYGSKSLQVTEGNPEQEHPQLTVNISSHELTDIEKERDLHAFFRNIKLKAFFSNHDKTTVNPIGEGNSLLGNNNLLLDVLNLRNKSLFTPSVYNNSIETFIQLVLKDIDVLKDVTSLYTSITHESGLGAMRQAIFTSNSFTDFQCEFILELLQMVLYCNSFLFQDSFYIQCQGTAMGSNVAPTYANVFMNIYKERRIAGNENDVLVFTWSAGILEYVDSSNDLQPYTAYEYSVTAQNLMGYVESLWTLIHTLEAAPEYIESPFVHVLSAYSLFVNWTQPGFPNGVIKYYRVIYKVSRGDQTPNHNIRALTVNVLKISDISCFDAKCEKRAAGIEVDSSVKGASTGHWGCRLGEGLVLQLELAMGDCSAAKYEGMGTFHHAEVFGLLPATIYDICIEVINSAGKMSSPWIFVQTLEASPSGLNNFTVEKKETGRALLLKWQEPKRTNGILKMYNIFSDAHLEYSGLTHQFLFRRLESYTNYTLVLEACTAAGCTRTFPQIIQTDEASPISQAPPEAQLLNSSKIELKWSPPIHPNGKVTHYNIIKRSEQANSSRKTRDEKIIYTEIETDRTIFKYTDEELHPWTSYEYKIRAWNSAGHTDSLWTAVQTGQAAPSRLPPPKVFHVEDSPHQLTIFWEKPGEENGIILSYRLNRNNSTFPFSFDSATFNYTDDELLAYSDYSYSVIACTIGGCTTSDPTFIKTLEAPPSSVDPPNVYSLSSTEINVTWSSPLIQNGKITNYSIQLGAENYFAGKSLLRIISDLKPFTLYNISVLACTNGGCTSSLSTLYRTMEAPPQDMKAPSFQVTGPESVKVMWKFPEKPNGEIRRYELRRDDILIYAGSDTHYYDFALEPGIEYSYTITAINEQGRTISPSAKVKSLSSSPSGMEPPKMNTRSAHEVLVSWSPPSRPNGDIINYTLSIRHSVETEVKIYYFNNSFASYMGRSFIMKDLKPYSQYEAKVEACNVLGCALSEWATGYTLEAPPEMQPAPIIDLQTNQQVPVLIWNGPKHPNGKILYYELYRQKIQDLEDIAHSELVFNRSSTLFKDIDVLPYTEYKYQLWAVNSAGKTASSWTYCKTGPADPEGILAPTFSNVSSTQAVANIPPPTQPNGIVSLYRLYATNNDGADTVLSEGTSNMQMIYGLKPFTNYSISVEACTCLKCCSRGPRVQITTQPAAPSQQPSPLITDVTSRAVSLHWNKPQSPNGIIENYEVHIQISCPQPIQIVLMLCMPGPTEVKCAGKDESCNITDLEPYTNYSIRVVSFNSVGSTASEWISCITQKEKPVYNTLPSISSNMTTIFLDWSLSFQLNGHLKEFILTERKQRIYSGLDTSIYIQRTTDKTFFFQVKCITDMGSVSTPIVKYNSATGLDPVLTFPSAKNETETSGTIIYTELWFIIVMAILGLILLAAFLSLALQRKLRKQPYARERPPLVPLQQRISSSSSYSQNGTYMCEPVADVSSSHRIMLKSYTMHAEGISDISIPGLETHCTHNITAVRKSSQISHSFSQNSLYRSASELITSHDKKSLVDSSVWDSGIHGHDSRMYVDDEDLISTIKSFSTMTKQHTAFTDTPL